ncbi:uncharacterized protein LOC100831436 [Brachypodium distachyon]|uniref:Uncharacterized protein n=1 Tax=Brachypodium distachyon TaxID=15368 RepID=I1ID53_BRADI|nr:uncharacterized protein LOC100831436 [Brachypodium distachyon]KQK00993.1 hypothetical protein BRADI_3g53140v3 [Brachypodium distachyon]|eukprot:XP_003570221.1 uncharacterized protein LOC100831436 [Brachypodium distachyon]
MGVSLAQAVAALMGRCARRLSRAAHRLQARVGPGLAASFSSGAVVPFVGGRKSKKKAALPWTSKNRRRTRKPAEEWSFEEDVEDSGVWRKEILMGERCQPLEFSGAIYYDAEGRRLGAPPPPRTPMRSPLPASIKLAANA